MSVWIFKAAEEDVEKSGDSLHQQSAFLNAQFNIPEVFGHPALRRSDWPRFYAFSATGYSNKVLHAAVMEKFGKIWRTAHPTMYCYLFGDQLAAHKTVTTVRNTLENNVMCWLLPANTSHFLQPLDDTVFANFKRILTSLVEKVRLKQDASPLQIKMSLYQCAYAAERHAFTPRIIQRAFLNTGIFPFDPARILHLLALNSVNGAKKRDVSISASWLSL
jgi:hypothetical protein